MSDEIVNTLSHIQGIAVRPFTASRKYAQNDLDLKKTGKELGAAVIVGGHFIKEGQQLYITLEAIDVDTNALVWSAKIMQPRQA